MCECFRSHLLRVGLLGRQRAGLFVQRLDDGPVAADLLRHVLVLLHQSLSGELVVADVHAGDDPQHVQHPRVDVVGVGLQRDGEEFNVMLPDTETATWNMKFRPLISLSFHLELVLVAGLLQTSFTDRRETLQSSPLLLQQEGRKDGRKERRKEGRKEGRKVSGNDATVTEDSGCSGKIYMKMIRTVSGPVAGFSQIKGGKRSQNHKYLQLSRDQ